MARLGIKDLHGVLELVLELGTYQREEPFQLEVLLELQRLVDADAVGYVETGADDTVSCGVREVVTRRPPPGFVKTLDDVGREDPTHRIYCHGRADAVAISDFLSAKSFQGRRIYELVCEPLGVADSLRLYLPEEGGLGCCFFFFDRSKRGFSDRSRLLLETLRPHFAQALAHWRDDAPLDAGGRLTAREAEVLRQVASGATNTQIGRRLWMSENTVRTHLDHIYKKLGVHNRTAAIACARQRVPRHHRADPAETRS